MRSIGKPVEQTFQQDSTGNHPNGRAQPVRHRVEVHRGERATRGGHDPHGGQQLAGPVHIDTELLEHRRAVGPDGDGTTAGRHVRPLVEHGDVVSVAQ